jgi:hypothetical protein
MDQHLSALLEYVREFAEPQGPDPLWWDERDRREAEWVRSRTTDDLLALVGWIKEPTLPADWAVPTWKGWLSGVVSNAAYLVARAGRGNRDPRLLFALVDLLADPRHTERAVELLKDMDESIYALVDGLPDAEVPIVKDLAAAATPELAHALHEIGQAPGLWEDYRVVISAVVDEWRRLNPDAANA